MIAAAVIAEVLPLLHASSFADLGGWTESDLYKFLNDSLARRHREAALLVDQFPHNLLANTQTFALHTTVVSLIDVTWQNRCLVPRTPIEMDAQDRVWQSRVDIAPKAYVLEEQGVGVIRLTPIPSTAGQAVTLFRAVPAKQNAASNLTALWIVDVICVFDVVAEANQRKGTFEFPESAGFAESMADLLMSAAASYYGGAL